jgi:hypothetical protein
VTASLFSIDWSAPSARESRADLLVAGTAHAD